MHGRENIDLHAWLLGQFPFAGVQLEFKGEATCRSIEYVEGENIGIQIWIRKREKVLRMPRFAANSFPHGDFKYRSLT